MASAIGETGQHGPDVGRDARYQLGQAVFAGAVQFSRAIVLYRTKKIIQRLRGWKNLKIPLPHDATQLSTNGYPGTR